MEKVDAYDDARRVVLPPGRRLGSIFRDFLLSSLTEKGINALFDTFKTCRRGVPQTQNAARNGSVNAGFREDAPPPSVNALLTQAGTSRPRTMKKLLIAVSRACY